MYSHKLFIVMHTENGDRIAGFLFEPIQGEAGVCLLWNECFLISRKCVRENFLDINAFDNYDQERIF